GGEGKAAAGSALDKAEKAVRIAAKAAKEFGDGKTGESLGADEILALEARREELKGTAESLKGTIRRYGQFGDFDPVLVKRLESAGVRLLLKDNGTYAFAYGGETLDEEVMAIFEGILNGRKNIEEMRAEIEAIKAPKEEVPAAEKEVSSNMKLCVSCGKEISADAKFCLNCGAQQP
ncbi:MAG: zinc ribbon domain-containing protein, partial [Oscillospiraceae bacterium]|nr:zinc ribbon domain-containing protein [Oscillospiraceae bacterium]